MIVETFHRAVVGELKRGLESVHGHQMNLVTRKAHMSPTGFVHASSCEEVAMRAVELTARARAIQDAIDVVNDAYRRMFKEDGEE